MNRFRTILMKTPGKTMWLGAAAAAIGQSFLVRFEVPWTLWIGLAFFICAVLLFNRGVSGSSGPLSGREDPLSARREWFYLLLIAVSTIGLRTYRIAELPPGIYLDSASIGVGGLRVLHEHWLPVTPTPAFPHPGLIYYLSATWFYFLPNTQTSLAMFLVFVSLWSYPFIYWVYRQLAGPKTALLALSLLALSRWDISFARRGHAIEHVGFFIFAVLALWLHTLRNRKTRLLVPLGAVFALGFYTYHSYKVFPLLMAVLLLYEIRKRPEAFRGKGWAWAVSGVIASVLLIPMAGYWMQEGFVNRYEMGLSIMRYIGEPHGLQTFLKSTAQTLLMFNRKGDRFVLNNSNSHRMLDDVTGILWVLGLGYALWRWRERRFLYPLAGLAVFGLNGFLSSPTQGNRMLNTLPFLTLLAAYPMGALVDSLAPRPGNRSFRFLPGVLLASLLAMCFFQNARQYFHVQARDPACWRIFDVEATDIGRHVARDGGEYDFYIASRYANHNTLRFLAYKRRGACTLMNLPADLMLARISPGKKGVCFVLDEGKWGVRDFLRRFYPGCREEVFPDRDGRTLVTYVRVDRKDLESVRGCRGRVDGGPWRIYPDFPNDLPEESSDMVQAGTLYLSRGGHYRVDSPNGRVRWKVSGCPSRPGPWISLEAGFMPFRLEWRRTRNSGRPLIRLWARDGDQERLETWGTTTWPELHGLRGEYWRADGPDGDPPAAVRWDPIINYTYRTDLPWPDPPLYARWKGILQVPKNGVYQFLAKTESDDRSVIRLDGRPLTEWGSSSLGSVTLKSGDHDIELDYLMGTDFFSSISLAWKRPGRDRFEVIGWESFGFPYHGTSVRRTPSVEVR